jgi:hypothetical protein
MIGHSVWRAVAKPDLDDRSAVASLTVVIAIFDIVSALQRMRRSTILGPLVKQWINPELCPVRAWGMSETVHTADSEQDVGAFIE